MTFLSDFVRIMYFPRYKNWIITFSFASIKKYACRHCSNYFFILDLISGSNGLGKDNRKTNEKQLGLGILCALYKRFNGICSRSITVVVLSWANAT